MADEDTDPSQPKYMTFANSKVPMVGPLIDYLDIGYHYLTSKSFTNAEKLRPNEARAKLSATFLAVVCLFLGFVANVKFEVVKYDETPLEYDLHFMLMSKEANIYINDIDPARVMWCFEASDCAALLISCLLIWNSSNVRSPLSEYLFLPWLGVTLRGLVLRQLPTASALVYAMAAIDGQHVNLLFLSAISCLFLLESCVCLDVVRVVMARWGRRALAAHAAQAELHTLWTNDEDVLSVEMRNFVY